ncbi:MAG: hypothetical protein KF745_13195 [Phycisphaeraceae bacterium]|nr:hypothetical protein [Phycisphaeraceae bacterium]
MKRDGGVARHYRCGGSRPIEHNGLTIAISPYHLTTREEPAMAALLLADRAVTLLPVPEGFVGGMEGPGRGQIREAVEHSPRFLRLMESWRWTMPLWRAGVLASTVGVEDTADEPREVWDELSGDERWGPVRALIRPTLFENPELHLDMLCGDLLKGGPDPGIGLLLTAGLDRFAARHGAIVARAGFETGCGSVTQRAEALMARRRAAVAVPVLLRASGAMVLRARRVLAGELAALRGAIAAGVAGDPGAVAGLADAAAEYARAFERVRAQFIGDDDDGERVLDGFVSLSLVHLPLEAAVRSCLTAARALAGRQRGAALEAGPTGEERGEGFLAMVVRKMNIRPEPPHGGGAAAGRGAVR